MDETILFVDDDRDILNSVQRVFADSEIDGLYVQSPEQALELCRRKRIALIVSDNQMPGMSGIELLSRLKEESPQTVKILMTAYADLTTALQAINKGEVYRFLVKPWTNEELIKTVSEGLARYRVLTTLHGEDEAILRSLAQTIELKDHYTRGHCERVAVYALTISEGLKLPPQVQQEIRHGSWLHDCGKIGVPEAVLNSAEMLSVQDWEVVRKHPEWGATVAEQANLSPTVINIIRHHHERFDGTGYPSALKGEAIPLEARIVAVADVYDALRTERPYKKAHDLEEARKILIDMKGSVLDHSLVDLFLAAQQLRELP